jgi:MoaA/NifB/PqqE/SkfB family radical SAM enzyme
MKRYGEIFFLGKCNQKCFYCLGNEMPKASQQDWLTTPFTHFLDFFRFIDILRYRDIDEVYLSSVNTEPLLYKYRKQLVEYLHKKGFKVGIRTNGTIYDDLLKELDGEISISINSFNDETNKKICGRKSPYETVKKILDNLRGLGKTVRISVLINKYNVDEFDDMLNKLKDYSDVIDYIQIRRWYTLHDTADNTPYDNCVQFIKDNYKHVGNFYESDIYETEHGVKVSLWNTVFKKESVQSVNYFPDGKISDYNLLIPIYEENKNLI